MAAEAAVRARWGNGLVGRVAVALSVDDRPRRSTEVWSIGAVGEEVVAAALDSVSEVRSLHDRKIPGSRANIDHIVVTPAGIWVVDAKRYVNKRPERSLEGGLFGFGATEHLKVDGRRSDRLIDGVIGQVGRISSAVGGDVPVSATLCFVDADWPLFGGGFSVRGVRVSSPRMLRKQLTREATASPMFDVDAVAQRLAADFPPA